MENELVIIENEKAVTTSLKIADVFGKKHKHVLENIREVIRSAENSTNEMFCESEYYDTQNKRQPMYLMNRDGFTLLVMGFTGKEAMKFKLEYIDAFNKMEAMIKQNNEAIAHKPMSQLEVLQASINALVEQEHRLTAVESSVEQLNSKLNAFEEERKENVRLLIQERINDALPVPEMSKRDKIRKLVNLYSSYTNTLQIDVWRKIYDTLYYNYGVHVNSIKLLKKESKLEGLVRLGHTDKVYSIVCSICKNAGITTY